MIELRPYRDSDAPAAFALFRDPDVMRYVGDGNPIAAEEEPRVLEPIYRKYREDPTFHIWVVDVDGTFAGHAELKRRGGRTEYELIYVFAREFWGRGIGTAVVEKLLAEARAREIPFVIATVAADNHASKAVLRKFGFFDDASLSAELQTEAFRLDL